MHGTRKDLGFNIFSFDQTEDTKQRVYPDDNIKTGAYVLLEDGTEEHLRTPKYVRIEKILVVVDRLEETRAAYEAFGFEELSEIEEIDGKYNMFFFYQNTDGKSVRFEIIEPIDPKTPYGVFLERYGRGVYNVIFEQNPEYNNVIDTMTARGKL